MGPGELTAMEQDAAVSGSDNQMAPWVLRLITTVRSLQQQLADPNYLLDGQRVSRQDLLKLRGENHKLRKLLYGTV
jgi:hypothetical protein